MVNYKLRMPNETNEKSYLLKKYILPGSRLELFGLFLKCGGTYLLGAEPGCELPCKSRPAN